jgi:CheY-like chemotaxis protein
MIETVMDPSSMAAPGEDRSLLIVEDDKPFVTRLARAMEGRGYDVSTAESVEEAVARVREAPPAFAVIDMRLGDGNGLDVVAAIREKRPPQSLSLADLEFSDTQPPFGVFIGCNVKDLAGSGCWLWHRLRCFDRWMPRDAALVHLDDVTAY